MPRSSERHAEITSRKTARTTGAGRIAAFAVQAVENLLLAGRDVDAATARRLGAADRPSAFGAPGEQAQQIIVDVIDLAPQPVDGFRGQRWASGSKRICGNA